MRTFSISCMGEMSVRNGKGEWTSVLESALDDDEWWVLTRWRRAHKAINDKANFRVYGLLNNKKRLGEVTLEAEVVCSSEPGIPLRGGIVAERRRAVKRILERLHQVGFQAYKEEMTVDGRIHALCVQVVVGSSRDVESAEMALRKYLHQENLMNEVMAVY